MGFWNDVTTEPKRQFRYYATFGGNDPGSKIESYAIKSVTKPAFTVGSVPHQYVAHTFYYPGRITWSPVDITFVDPVNPDSSAVVSNMIVQAGYRKPLDENTARKSFSKQNFKNALGQITFNQIDAEGEKVDEWRLVNSFFTSVNYGTLDYGSEDLVVLSVTVQYDYAEYVNMGVASPNSLLESNATGS
tara:strand:- start:10094 stop:10660 length:567 start_codon:yes stop_codon:yes gene_type:complete